MRLFILPIVLATSACAAGPQTDFYGNIYGAFIPADVRLFITDAQGCHHFSGEEHYDTERATFLKKHINKMCAGIEQRHKRLTAKYAQNKDVTAIISQSWSVFE